jgi:dephospho-CoA kinase
MRQPLLVIGGFLLIGLGLAKVVGLLFLAPNDDTRTGFVVKQTGYAISFIATGIGLLFMGWQNSPTRRSGSNERNRTRTHGPVNQNRPLRPGRLTALPILGLVGGIGSGKSFVAGLFAELGAKVVEGDQAGHEALKQPEIKNQVIEKWGDGVRNAEGEIDRRKLGSIVFADPQQLAALEAIVFPWIKEKLRRELVEAAKDPQTRLLILDAAVMMEAGWSGICDAIVFVDAPLEVRQNRVTGRGWSREEWEKRERSQMPLVEKKARCQAVVENAGDLVRTRHQVRALFDQWTQHSALARTSAGQCGENRDSMNP